MYSTLFMSW